MNADIPYLRVWVDNSFTTGCPGQEEGYAFAIQSYPARALAFHVMLKSGAHFRNLPIHALALREGAATEELENCQLWDCFSFRPVVTVFAYLLEHEAVCYTRRGPIPGEYLFTVDWLPDSLSAPGWLARPEQAKCAHVLALATGRLAALPTNRVAWKDGYFVGDSPDPRSRGYRVQEEVYRSESSSFDASGSSEWAYGPISVPGLWTPVQGERPSERTPGPLASNGPVCGAP
jgi:hypothetical protein